MRAYKKLPSVEYIIYIEQDFPFITLFKRIESTNVWENSDFEKLDQTFLIESEEFSLDRIYRNVIFKN